MHIHFSSRKLITFRFFHFVCLHIEQLKLEQLKMICWKNKINYCVISYTYFFIFNTGTAVSASMNTRLTWMVGDLVHNEHIGTGREEHRWNRITRKPMVRSFAAPATRLVSRIHWIVVKVSRSTSVIKNNKKIFLKQNKYKSGTRDFVPPRLFFEWLCTLGLCLLTLK